MTLEKQTQWGRMEIYPGDTIHIKYKLVIVESGSEIAYNNLQDVLTPGSDITSYPQKIQDIINTVWDENPLD